jgi:hypothetical protein
MTPAKKLRERSGTKQFACRRPLKQFYENAKAHMYKRCYSKWKADLQYHACCITLKAWALNAKHTDLVHSTLHSPRMHHVSIYHTSTLV